MMFVSGNLCKLSPMINFKRFFTTYYATTPIFYVNASPHLGHLYSALIADASARFVRLKNSKGDVILCTGTDEHGSKIQKAAESNNIPVDTYCDKISEEYRNLFNFFGINYSTFVRTTSKEHCDAVCHFWNVLEQKGYIYSGHYSGWYSIQDESFLSENDVHLVNDKQGNEVRVSKESNHPVEWTEESNMMFRLSYFKRDLLHWLSNEDTVAPVKFHTILKNWISDENIMRDISISRPKNRMSWGIPVPNNPSQTVYVWLDALVNYLTAVGYPDMTAWPADVHICGKDILKFHGIYWPAFLIAAGLEPPRKLFVHSHWTVDSEKMSKSKNNVVNPYDVAKKYTASGLRYFLLKGGVPHSDGNFTEHKIRNMLNADLANTLGNLLNRCCAQTVNRKQEFPSYSFPDVYNLKQRFNSLSKLMDSLSSLSQVVDEHYTDLNFYKGLDAIIATLHLGNKFFDESKVWELSRHKDNQSQVSCILHVSMETLRITGIALQPIVPDISELLLNKLSVPQKERTWASMVPSWRTSGSHVDNIGIGLNKDKVILYKKVES